MHPGQKLKPGALVRFEGDGGRADGGGARAAVLRPAPGPACGPSTRRTTSTRWSTRIGHVPLPPYIHRADTPDDRERYQTVFARARGSIAAPTAGLHFDDGAARGARRARRRARHASRCTSATARSSRCASSDVEEHVVDPEPYEISAGGRGSDQCARSTRGAASLRSARRRRARSRMRRGAEAARFEPGAGAGGALHLSRVRLPRHRGPADELPPAEVVAADAGGGVRRPRARARAPTARRSSSATGSTATATRCWLSEVEVARCDGRWSRGPMDAGSMGRDLRGIVRRVKFPTKSSISPASRRIRWRRGRARRTRRISRRRSGRGSGAPAGRRRSRPSWRRPTSRRSCRGDARRARRRARHHLGTRRARPQDRAVAGAHRPDGARLRLGARDQRRRRHSRFRARALGRDVGGRRRSARARAASAWRRRPDAS